MRRLFFLISYFIHGFIMLINPFFLFESSAANSALAKVTCRISEFSCRNKNVCIPSNKYCDGYDNCGDGSDEPKFCSVCNRTYYGEADKTYNLELQKPSENRLPFLCHLTFIANGFDYGDIIQLAFEKFHIGRLESTELDSCPDGQMQILELGHPYTGGSWCGGSSDMGIPIYYSESSTVTVTLRLFFTGRYQNTAFEFKLRYKYIKKEEAITRYGTNDSPIERGALVPGTFCSRNFFECNRKKCQVQSPNYPGIYSRNVTCVFRIHQKIVPRCKHVMISVSQKFPGKFHLKRSLDFINNNSDNNQTIMTEKQLLLSSKVWDDCKNAKDYIIIYDGLTMDDEILLKFCGGSIFPEILSRSSEMLVVFVSSPFSIPIASSDWSNSLAAGFELDVDTVFTDSDSYDFSRHPKKCEFLINATEPDIENGMSIKLKNRIGRISSPRHTLPPNTTCIYKFEGQNFDKIWISIASYWHEALLSSTKDHQTISCPVRLEILDGSGKFLGDHCDRPKICDHSALRNHSRFTRPCTPDESYISSTSSLIINYYSKFGTAVHSSRFLLYYEIVNTDLGGAPLKLESKSQYRACGRLFKGIHSSDILSPRNVFMFGRGGAEKLTCLYRIEADPGEKIKFTLYNVSFGSNSNCNNQMNPYNQNANICSHLDADPTKQTFMEISETPWKSMRIQKTCICDNLTLGKIPGKIFSFTSSSRVVEIRFKVYYLNNSEDYFNIYFYAHFDIIRIPDCPRKQKLMGYGGEIKIIHPPKEKVDIYCQHVPWLVEARKNHSIFLLTWGHFLAVHPAPDDPVKCSTQNRILLYTGTPLRLFRVICPMSRNDSKHEIHIFSEEWNGRPYKKIFPNLPFFLVQFIGHEAGNYILSWLEISRSKKPSSEKLNGEVFTTKSDDNQTTVILELNCPFKCPELNACIDEHFWCDGYRNCPSGFDEREDQCDAFKIRILQNYLTLISSGIGLGIFTLIVMICTILRFRGKRKKLEQIPPVTRRIGTQSTLYDPSNSTMSS